LQGAKNRYGTGETFGVVLYVDDVPMSRANARLITSVDRDAGEDVLHFQITSEEVAWLATANSLTIKTFNVETNIRYDSFVFTPLALTEFKKFAKSVHLIRSM